MLKVQNGKKYRNVADPHERFYAENVSLANDIVVATTKLNGFVETLFMQINAPQTT